MILEGQLRVMPPPANRITVNQTVATVRQLLDKAQCHMDAGRIPILRKETQDGIVEQAKKLEIEKYGQLLTPEKRSPFGTFIRERAAPVAADTVLKTHGASLPPSWLQER